MNVKIEMLKCDKILNRNDIYSFMNSQQLIFLPEFSLENIVVFSFEFPFFFFFKYIFSRNKQEFKLFLFFFIYTNLIFPRCLATF